MTNSLWPVAAVVMGILVGAAAPVSADTAQDLEALLVDLPGWDGAEKEGWVLGEAGSRIVSAMRQYTDAGRTLDVKIVAGVAAQGGWDPSLKEGLKVDTSEVLMEVRRVDGFLVHSSYEKASTSGAITVFINDPSASPGPAALLTLDFEGLRTEDAMKAIRKLDWKAIKRIVATLK